MFKGFCLSSSTLPGCSAPAMTLPDGAASAALTMAAMHDWCAALVSRAGALLPPALGGAASPGRGESEHAVPGQGEQEAAGETADGAADEAVMVAVRGVEEMLAQAGSDIEQACIIEALIDAIWAAHQVAEEACDRPSLALLAKVVARLVHLQVVPHRLILERLEPTLLEEAALLTSAAAFSKKVARVNTASLYRQQKYNLLREESEGFSKVVVLLDGLGNEAAASDDGGQVYDRLVAIIGFFDLDPSRVIDLIMDAFALFVSLGRPHARLLGLLERFAFPTETVTALVGFKMAPIAKGHRRVPLEMLRALLLMTAILISRGRVSFEGIYPHLCRPGGVDGDATAGEAALVEIVANGDIAPGGMQGTSSGVPLGEGALHQPACHSVAHEVERLTADAYAANLLALLTEALLRVGEIGRACMMLERFPAFSTYPAITQAICAVIHVIIEPVFSSPILACARSAALVEDREGGHGLPPAGRAFFVDTCSQVQLMGLLEIPLLPKEGAPEEGEYRAFVRGTGLLAVLLRWLRYGPRGGLYADCVLLTKIARFGRAHLDAVGWKARGGEGAVTKSYEEGTEDCEERAFIAKQWLSIAKNHLLPSLMASHASASSAHEVWRLIERFPYHSRYAMYASLDAAGASRGRGETGEDEDARRSYKGHAPLIALASTIARGDTRRVMRRLTVENVKQYGRLLAKLTHAAPTVVLPIILDQLQAYDNLIQPVVDALKYLTPLAFDVLSCTLVGALGRPSRGHRLKEDGTSIAMWLQSLAAFGGALYKKYDRANVHSLLDYIVNQLRAGCAFDLVVLSALIARMTGIECNVNISDDHLEAIVGGGALLQEAVIAEGAKGAAAAVPLGRAFRRSTMRLVSALQVHGLAVPLWRLLAQQRSITAFARDDSSGGDLVHLKQLGTLLDQGERHT